MADFTLWNKKDKGGSSDSYTGNQGQTGILNTNSLETYDSTWVIIFSKNDYDYDKDSTTGNGDGDYKLLNPNTYLSHLKNEDKGSDGNWENNVKSFILYKTQPSWWNSGSRPTYDELFAQASGQALFTKAPNYQDDNRVFLVPTSEVSLLNANYTSSGRRMDDEYDPGNISSISTGLDAWLVVYSGSNCVGDFYKIDENTMLPDLGTIDRYDMDGVRQGDWANDISSFLLYASKPIFWDTDYSGPYLNPQDFCKAYPNGSLNNSNQVEYIIANDTYKIDYPDTLQTATASLPDYHGSIDMDNLPTDGWTSFDVNMEHHNVAGQNDSSSFYLIFDNNSSLIDIQQFVWNSSDGSFTIDETTIATVDLDLEVLGDETAIETCGVTIVVANVLATVFDTVCGVFNHITSALFNKNDDGGRYYFLPVICHTINRISSTVFNNYGISPYTSSDDPRANLILNFNYSAFKNALSSADSNFSSISDWEELPGANGISPNNNVMETVYQGYNYRTWYIETSMTQSLGMLVSSKIAYEASSGDEDYIILIAGFTMPTIDSVEPILAFAQAIIQFADNTDENIMSTLCSTGDIVESLYSDLQNQLNELTFSDENQGRQYLADITKANLNGIVTSTVTQNLT